MTRLSRGLLSLSFIAAVQFPATAAENPVVVESIGAPARSVPYQPPVETDEGQGGIESQYQMQLLQQEVMELRGQVEELKFQLQKMKATQDDRYLELDGRLQQVMKMKATAAVPEVVPEETEPAPDGQAPISETLSEKELYDTSLQLIRNRQYDLAITQLDTLIARFPDGVYAANAYYWLGEVYAAKPTPDYEKARQALAQVITFFPDHRKVPDAAFKLGKVYHLLGDCERAEEILNQVMEQHAGKSVATLAKSYLEESVQCEN